MFNVRVIGNDALPARQDWAMVEVDGRVTFCVKRSAMSPDVLAEAHLAFYQLRKRPASPVGQRLALG